MNDETDYLIGEVEGYRAFEVLADTLYSVGYEEYPWVPGGNRAHCDRVPGTRVRKVWVNDPTDPTGLAETEELIASHGRIPSPRCSCGFWFYRAEWSCRDHFAEQLNRRGGPAIGGTYGGFGVPDDDRWVMGKVKAWGRILEGVDGYRSEYARITALVTDEAAAYEDIMAHYGIGATRPRTKLQEGYSSAWVTKFIDGDPPEVKLVNIERTQDSDGTFLVDPGLTVPAPGHKVTVRFEPRGTMRWITAITVHDEEA